jgi:glycosyltransferase involved in cell wall biosynthesis
MLQFALDAIVAFSGTPLRLAAYVGFLVSCLAFLYGGYAVAVTLLRNDVVRGWSSTILVTLVLGGVQLLALGIIGEYLDRIYAEVKRRPLFLVRRSLGLNTPAAPVTDSNASENE